MQNNQYRISTLNLMLLAAIFITYVSSSRAESPSHVKPAATPPTSIQKLMHMKADDQTLADQNRTQRHDCHGKNNNNQLQIAMRAMPKGADLHSHLSGAVYAEDIIGYGQDLDACVDKNAAAVGLGAIRNPQCKNQFSLKTLNTNPSRYDSIVNAWSLRQYPTGNASSHDHFFDTFLKFWPIYDQNRGHALADVARRAGQEHILYLEQFLIMPDNHLKDLSDRITWDSNFSKYEKALNANGLSDIVKQYQSQMSDFLKEKDRRLGCDKNSDAQGCNVRFRFVYLAFRDQDPRYVFAQLLAGFQLASVDSRFLAVNLVQPEDAYRTLRDYKLQMQMVAYLHEKFPTVHITLHAGELNPEAVRPDALTSHIHDAVFTAHAERIGHGVDVAYENDADQLLKYMADHKIAVEINLTSNDKILSIKKDSHPLPLYLAYGVPVVIATDDQGVLRTDLSREYARAVSEHHLSVEQIIQINRNSLTYSFLPGESLWKSDQSVVDVCAQDSLGSEHPQPQCAAFLQQNTKASLQWELESKLKVWMTKFNIN